MVGLWKNDFFEGGLGPGKLSAGWPRVPILITKGFQVGACPRPSWPPYSSIGFPFCEVFSRYFGFLKK